MKTVGPIEREIAIASPNQASGLVTSMSASGSRRVVRNRPHWAQPSRIDRGNRLLDERSRSPSNAARPWPRQVQGYLPNQAQIANGAGAACPPPAPRVHKHSLIFPRRQATLRSTSFARFIDPRSKRSAAGCRIGSRTSTAGAGRQVSCRRLVDSQGSPLSTQEPITFCPRRDHCSRGDRRAARRPRLWAAEEIAGGETTKGGQLH